MPVSGLDAARMAKSWRIVLDGGARQNIVHGRREHGHRGTIIKTIKCHIKRPSRGP